MAIISPSGDGFSLALGPWRSRCKTGENSREMGVWEVIRTAGEWLRTLYAWGGAVVHLLGERCPFFCSNNEQCSEAKVAEMATKLGFREITSHRHRRGTGFVLRQFVAVVVTVMGGC